MGIFTDVVSGASGGGAISALGSVLSGFLGNSMQRSNLNNEYEQFVSAMRKNGATPASIVAGLSGSGVQGTPSQATGFAIPNMGELFANASNVQSEKDMRDQQIAEIQQSMLFNPSKWRAEIRKTILQGNREMSEIDKNYFHGRYFNEMANQLVTLTPLEANRLSKELIRLDSEISLNKMKVSTEASLKRYYESQSDRNYSEQFNVDLRSYELQWRNSLMSVGLNPDENVWRSLGRLAFSDPVKFHASLGYLVNSINKADNVMKSSLGDHYKRNAMMLGGLYMLDKRRQQGFDNFIDLGNMVSGFVPLSSNKISKPIGFRK